MSATYVQPSSGVLAQALVQQRAQRKLTAGVDLAFSHDGCALVIVEHHDDCLEVVDFDFRVPRPGEPLDPVAVADTYMSRLEAVGCNVVAADVHYIEVVRRAANMHGISLVNAPLGDDRLRAFVTTRHYTRARALRIPRLIADHLRKIQLIVRPGGGFAVQAPRTDGKGHADLAFALVAAVHVDSKRHGIIGEITTQIATHRGAWTAP